MKTSLLCFSVLVLYVTDVQSLPNLPGFDPNIFGLKTVVHLMKSVFDAGVDILRPTEKHYDNNVLIVIPKASNHFKNLDEKVIFEDNNKRNRDHAKNHLADTFKLKYNPAIKIFEGSIESSPLHVIEKVTSNIEPLTNILLKPDRKMENGSFPRHDDEKLSKEYRNIKNERYNFENDEKFHNGNTEFDKSVFEEEIIYEENESDNNRGSFQKYKNENNKDFAIEEELHKQLKMAEKFDDIRVDMTDEKIGEKRRPTLEMSGKNNFPVLYDDKEDKHHTYNNQDRELFKEFTFNMKKPPRHIYEPSLTVEKSERNDRLVDQTKLKSYDTRIFDKTKSVGENEEFFSFNETLTDGVMERDVTENFDEHENYYRNVKSDPSNQSIVSRKKTFSVLDERSNERDKDKTDVRKSQEHYIYKDDDSKNHNREAISPMYVLERSFFPETKLRKEDNFKILVPESRHIPSSIANTAGVRPLGFIEHNLDKPVIIISKIPIVIKESNRKYNRG